MSYIRNMAYLDKNGLSLYGMIQIFEKINFKAEVLKGNFAELLKETKERKRAVIALIVNDDNREHYIIVKKIEKEKVNIFDPAIGNR